MSDYAAELLAKARAEYKYLDRHNPVVTVGKGEGFAETWPIDEPGAPHDPRPRGIPIDRHGVEVRMPEKFSHHDLAAEFIHIDPVANNARRELLKSMTTDQIHTLQDNANDYKMSEKLNLPYSKAMENATDSALRGYTTGQWPASVDKAMNYSKEQQQILDDLKEYMKSGVEPVDHFSQGFTE